MSTLATPEFEEPVVPTREYWFNPGRTVKTNERTRPESGALEYQLKNSSKWDETEGNQDVVVLVQTTKKEKIL